MAPIDLCFVRQACACFVSEAALILRHSEYVAGNKRRELYWRAKSVVEHDRALRMFDVAPRRLKQGGAA